MGNCFGNGGQTNPGSVLDRVISQASNDDDCLLYKLANYKKGGELVDAYNIGGAAEVEKLIRSEFGILMYKEGKGQVISRTEYLRWKFRNQKHVVIPVEATSSTDPLAKWEDHEACWQMQYRGSLGETLMHVLIICDTRLHTRLARILLKCFPKLAVDVVEGEEYLGASSLHLAIAYNNNDLVHLLVESGAIIEQRAVGSFFLPRDQQRLKPAKFSDYEGLAYLGEYPLAWAACMGHESVYNLLLDEGANPDNQDSFGNMILHMVVVTDQLGMYGYALRHPKVQADSTITNYQGLTPLTLACRLGRASVFREMLELSAREFWRYSNITCSAYPLNALDTILPDGRTNWNSALFMILAGSKEEHLDMLDGGIIQRLLDEKWKTYAQRQFLKRISIAFLQIMAMSMAIYLRPSDRNTSLLDYSNAQDAIRICFEVGSVFGSISYVFFQQGEEIKNQGFVSFVKQLPQAPPKLIFLVANFLILGCIPLRMIGDVKTEEEFLSFAMVGSWFFMMFFAGAIQLTGPFVTMVYSMITGDMLTFGIIFVIFLLSFSQSFYYLFKSHPQVAGTLFENYHTTWMGLYQMTLGSWDYSKLSETGYPNVSKAVFIIFMIMVPILLLNMLIAMMGNTYSQVIERSEKECIKQWAKIVVSLERSVSQEDAKNYIQEYSIKLGGSDPSNELRGVMVIKSKSKTRANQRKGAVSNWKRVGKVTIQALKKRGMTGEEMRQLMWGHRNSICTPTTATPRQQSMEVDLAHLQGLHRDGLGLGGMDSVGGFLDSALDQLQFSTSLDLPNPPLGNQPLPQAGALQSVTSLNPTAMANGNVPHSHPTPGSGPTPNPAVPQNKLNNPAVNPVGVKTLAASPIVTTVGPATPTSTIQTTTTATTPTSILPTSHITPADPTIVPSPSPSKLSPSPKPPKQKRRNIKFGLRPKIIIFSDQKDLIRVSLDSDETDSSGNDIFETSNDYFTYKSGQHNLTSGGPSAKSSRRKSIAGNTAMGSSRESLRGDTSEDDLDDNNDPHDPKGQGHTRSKSRGRKGAGGGGGVVNFAFEPEEFAAAEKKLINRVVIPSPTMAMAMAPKIHPNIISPPPPPSVKTPAKEHQQEQQQAAAPSPAPVQVQVREEEVKEIEIDKERSKAKGQSQSSRPKSAAASKAKVREPSSSTEALISDPDKDSSSPPPSEDKDRGQGQGQNEENVEKKSKKKEESGDSEPSSRKKKSSSHGRSKSAKNGNKVEPSSSSTSAEASSSSGRRHRGSSSKSRGRDDDDIEEESEDEERNSNSNSRSRSKSKSKSKSKSSARPATANNERPNISNMSNLVAWDRPEDDI